MRAGSTKNAITVGAAVASSTISKTCAVTTEPSPRT